LILQALNPPRSRASPYLGILSYAVPTSSLISKIMRYLWHKQTSTLLGRTYSRSAMIRVTSPMSPRLRAKASPMHLHMRLRWQQILIMRCSPLRFRQCSLHAYDWRTYRESRTFLVAMYRLTLPAIVFETLWHEMHTSEHWKLFFG
jgi:hypothetical protein